MPEPAKIEFVYFDLGNILVSFDPEVACVNLATRLDVSIDQARRALYESGLQEQFEHGEVSPDQFAETLHQTLGLELRSLSQSVRTSILDETSNMFVPIDSMAGAIAQVRGNGYRVGILSNTCHSHWDWIARQQYEVLRGPFEVSILSYEVGAMKPDARIYQAAEAAVDVPPERLLFIDDKPENIEAARNRGWNAVECFGGDEAIGVLRSFGLIHALT